MLQHGAYTLLTDSCYDRETFPTLEQALEWTWASTEAEIDAVKFVLSRFFKLNENGQFIQDRILEELFEYQSKADKNKQIAHERETKRKEKSTVRARVVNDSLQISHASSPNHKPITTNQEPITKNHKPKIQKPDGVLDSTWNDFVILRKEKKAAITETALNGIYREAMKAGMSLEQALRTCCERGWQGFKADWVSNLPKPTLAQQSTLAAARTIFGDERTLTDAYIIESPTKTLT